jgi:quinol monooxygenase YgiN
MYFIVVKFRPKDEYVDQWPELVREYTEATRQESGNLWFEWSKSLEVPNEYVLVEGFADDEAASTHVNSDHFKKMQQDFSQFLSETPKIISRKVEGSGWDEMGELKID